MEVEQSGLELVLMWDVSVGRVRLTCSAQCWPVLSVFFLWYSEHLLKLVGSYFGMEWSDKLVSYIKLPDNKRRSLFWILLASPEEWRQEKGQ